MKIDDFKPVGQFIRSIFFPQCCAFCNTLIESDEFVCKECDSRLPITGEETCLKCGCEKEFCDCSESEEHFYDGIAAPFYFEDGVRNSVFRLKFSGEKYIAEPLSDYMSDCFRKNFSDIEFDCITYVPMEKRKQKLRGYNQSRLLAAHLSEKLNIKLADGLIYKYCSTDIQHDLNYVERTGNIFGSFDVKNGKDLSGRNILLVDDIKTTGSTLEECAKMLKLYGADKVFCLTVAVVKSKIDKKK